MSKDINKDDHSIFEVVASKINSFLTKNKNIFVGFLLFLVLSIVVISIVLVVKEKTNTKKYSQLYELEAKLESALMTYDDNIISEEEEIVLESLLKFTKSNKKTFINSRANMLAAEIYFRNEDWSQAKTFYISAYNSSPKAYSAGLNAFNAAVCSENINEVEDAIKYYTLASESKSFLQKSRALFNIARIHEANNKFEKAIDFYQDLLSKYPDEQWADLAKSRLIVISK